VRVVRTLRDRCAFDDYVWESISFNREVVSKRSPAIDEALDDVVAKASKR
jgi:hypothetical protein